MDCDHNWDRKPEWLYRRDSPGTPLKVTGRWAWRWWQTCSKCGEHDVACMSDEERADHDEPCWDDARVAELWGRTRDEFIKGGFVPQEST